MAQRPYQVAVVALAAGLAAGPVSPWLVAVLAVGGVAAGWRSRAAAVAVLGVLGGAVAAEARLRALDPGVARAGIGTAVDARVVLLEPPRRRASGGKAATVSWRGDRLHLRGSRWLRWPPAGVGDRLRVRGRLAALGERDGWLVPRHVHALLLAGAVERTGGRRGGAPGALDGVRRRAEAALAGGVPPERGALLRGMVLGQDDALPDALREAFRRTGLAHVLAASGQNVMLLAGLGLGVAAVLGLGVRARLLLVLALIAVYVPLAGGGPSIQRAGVMGAAGVVALLAGRPGARWHALALAAAVTLALNPLAWREPGWQLSFAAVVALLALGPRLATALRERGLPRVAAEVVAVAVAAAVGTAPLVALHFERTSLVSLPVNVLAAPLVAPAMWLGMGAAAVGQVSLAAAAPLAVLAALPAAALAGLAEAAARVPGAEAAVPAAAVAAACTAAGAALWSRRARRAVLGLGLAAAGLWAAVAPAPARPPAGPRLAFLDVGQGDATVLQHGPHAVLVDTGPPDGPVVERLRAAGVRRLDALVATHAQADHLGAAAAVLRAMPVGVVLDGRDGVRERWGDALAAEARRRGVRLVPAVAGQAVRAGPIELRVRWPPPTPAAPGGDPNDRAIVAEARLGPLRVLLPADAESDVLARLDLDGADVLKVSHHGSADDGLPAVLDRVGPKVALIGVGEHNDYGHPATGTLQSLRAAGARTWRTDRDGTVLVTPGPGGGVRVRRGPT